MRFITPCALALACACVTPADETATSLAPDGGLPPEQQVQLQEQQSRDFSSAETTALVDRLAARVDMLRVQRSDLATFVGVGDPAGQRRQWMRSLAAFDMRLAEFEEAHPNLDENTRSELERTVIRPFRTLQGISRD